MKKVVIVGAGAGGGLVAGKLRGKTGRDEVEITVIDSYGITEFQPSYPMVSIGLKKPSEIGVKFENFSQTGIKPVKANVLSVNGDERIVKTDKGDVPYDVLVLSPGAKVENDKLPQSNNIGHFWDMENSLELKKKLMSIKEGKIVIGVSSMIYKCPPVPWEMAMLLNDMYTNMGIRERIEIKVVHWASKPMAMFGPVISDPVTNWVNEANIEGNYGFEVEKIDAENKKIISTRGDEESFDLAIMAPPHAVPDFVKNSEGLLSDKGWLDANTTNFRPQKYDDIYSLGDAIAPTLGLGMAGVFAHFQADSVVSFVLNDIEGIYPAFPYNKVGLCVSDMGSTGWISYCNFAGVMKNKSIPYPDCGVLGSGLLFKLAHTIYEKYFLGAIYGGWIR